MRITFTESGGATFIIYEHQDSSGKELAREEVSWIEVLRIGNLLRDRASAILERSIKLGNVSVVGRATVSDPPPKEPDDNPPANT